MILNTPMIYCEHLLEKISRLFFILPVFSIILLLPGTSFCEAAGAEDSPGKYPVSIIEVSDLIDKSRNRKVPIKVFYPTSRTSASPLIIISHGGGGSWDAQYAHGIHLASHGYVVFALEHVGSNTKVLKRWFRFLHNLKVMTRDATEVLGRPKDISFAIDTAIEWNRYHHILAGRIDNTRVGILGHSYGAYTVLVSAGARPALNWLTPKVPPGEGLGPDLHESRLRCGVALSPQGPGEPFFLKESYATIRIPILGISGTRDRQQSKIAASHRKQAFSLWPKQDKFFIWLNNADHLAFSDATGSDKRMLPSRSREGVQPLTRAASLLFFDWCLKEKSTKSQLSELYLKQFLKAPVDALEVLKR